jgi:hypothetical protein
MAFFKAYHFNTDKIDKVKYISENDEYLRENKSTFGNVNMTLTLVSGDRVCLEYFQKKNDGELSRDETSVKDTLL